MSTSTVTIAWLDGPQNTRFFTRYYQAATPKAVIVGVHGFGEHCTRYVDIHTKLADHGISVFTYDQRGFGETAQNIKERSKGQKYGKHNWEWQMEDLNWFITHTQKEAPGLPVYIMGQSMGGGEVLGFSTEGSKSPYASTIASLSGVIATSPMVQQTVPLNFILRKILYGMKLAAPYTLFPAGLIPGDLSRDITVGDTYLSDPLVQTSGSFRGIADMLDHGDELKAFRWKEFPAKLPILFCHGDGDRITSPVASREFYEKINAENKKYVSIPAAYHELSNEFPEVKEQLFNEVVAFVDSTIAAPAAKL